MFQFHFGSALARYRQIQPTLDESSVHLLYFRVFLPTAEAAGREAAGDAAKRYIDSSKSE